MPTPSIDSFWILLVEKKEGREARYNHLLQVAGAYYRIDHPGEYITTEFENFLKRNKKIPLIIKFNKALIKMSRSLVESKDLVFFRE